VRNVRRIARIADEVCRLRILPVDAWDNDMFPDFHNQPLLPFQAALNASACGGETNEGYGCAVALSTRMLRGLILKCSEVIRREDALTMKSGNSRDLSLVRNQSGVHWLVCRSLSFPLNEARDLLAVQGISLQGVIHPNIAGREGKWAITGSDPLPALPGECFRSWNHCFVIMQDLGPALISLGLEDSSGEANPPRLIPRRPYPKVDPSLLMGRAPKVLIGIRKFFLYGPFR
jgi:hypothetical protein